MSNFLIYLSTIKSQLQTVGEAVGVFVVGFLFGIWRTIANRRGVKANQELQNHRFFQKHTEIHELLTELRITIRASRCLIFQFHNGGSFASGTSIKRFSVTHESCATGVISMFLESQDVLLTRYMEMLRVLEQTPNKIIRVEDLPPSTFRSGLEINNVEYFSISSLKCVDSLSPLGFVCCHWCSADSLDEIESEGIDQKSIEDLIAESVRNINTHFSFRLGKKECL